MRWLAGIGWFGVCFSLLNASLALGDDSKLPDAAPEVSEGILVLRNGTVMAGTISQADDLYEVRGQYGTVQVPSGLVKMRCRNLHEAYLRLRELTVALLSVNSHVTLAKWCVTNRLDDEAVDELNDALKLEPDREDVQRMLRQVNDSLKTPPKPTIPLEREDPVRTARPETPAVDETSTLGGLSLPNALHYTRRIQPLLVNTCATAGCHSRDSRTGFELWHVAPGRAASRHASELNLAAVLEQINPSQPAESRLLKAPRGRHGRPGRPLFAGPRGEEQFAELEAWVVSAAHDVSRRSKSTAVEGPRKSGARTAAASGADSVAGRRGERDPFAGGPTRPAVPFSGEQRERKFSDSSRADPFDPAAFNRQSPGGGPRR